jgi:putative transposase
VKEIRAIIDQKPHAGVRTIHWTLNRGREKRVNIKAVHRVMKIKGWLMHKRPKGLRPRVEGWASRTSKPDVRWAVDMSHFMTKKDGWCQITAVIDCCDRSIVGWRVSKSGKAKVAAAALEDALIKRRPKPGLKLRSDNGLIFGAEDFHKVARSAGIRQEYITPYTPEQNGLIERWFRTLKTECLWLRQFETVEDARSAVASFIDVYHNERPHRSLNMLTLSEWMERFAA